MKKATKVWMIVAASLIAAGLILFVGVMSTLKWDFRMLSTDQTETNDYVIREPYQNISVITDTADVLILPSENGETSVICHEQRNRIHSVEVQDGTLVIELNDTRQWYEYIEIGFMSSRVTVYLPAGVYGAVSVRTDTGHVEIAENFRFESMDISGSTGDISNSASVSGTMKLKRSTGDILVKNVSAGALELSVSTGRVFASGVTVEGDVSVRTSTGKATLTDVACRNLTSAGSTGDVILENVIAEEKMSLTRSTGHVKLDGSDAAEIFVETDTGDVTGTLLSEKVFVVKTDTGDVDVPRSVTGGRCEITTDTGDIRITVTD